MSGDFADMELEDFKPPIWMRGAMMQTILASRKFRRKAAAHIAANATAHILDCGDGIRLKGSYTEHPNAKGVIIMLHGWEGSEDSTYVLSCSRFLYEQGYGIFRLNMRDHGDTHHLNEGIFNSTLFDEVFQGVRHGAEFLPDKPAYIVGFSLGGNFALRVARAHQDNPITNLSHVFAISPVIDPVEAAPAVDRNPLIKRYFKKKWTASLRKKQEAFPDVYDFSGMLEHKSVMDMTDRFLSRYSDFKNPDHYFAAYGIGKDDFLNSKLNVSMIMSIDDPVVPADAILKLNLSPCVRRIMLEYGGHNGFFQSLHGPTWYDDYIKCVLKAENS